MRASIQREQVYVAGPEIVITVYLSIYLSISSRPAYFGEAAVGSCSSWSFQAPRSSATKSRCSGGMPRRDQLKSST